LSPGVDRKIRAIAREMKLPVNRILELMILESLGKRRTIQDLREWYVLADKAKS
jgi:hypothetical protein